MVPVLNEFSDIGAWNLKGRFYNESEGSPGAKVIVLGKLQNHCLTNLSRSEKCKGLRSCLRLLEF
jgi:hypothetical protein